MPYGPVEQEAGQDKAASIGMISAERMLALALRAGQQERSCPALPFLFAAVQRPFLVCARRPQRSHRLNIHRMIRGVTLRRYDGDRFSNCRDCVFSSWISPQGI